MSTIKQISLRSLWINTENYRFEPNESQAEALAIMVEDQKDKLFKLAEDILINGMNPSDIPIVTDLPNHKGKFLILEGNRRVTAMKILDNPSLLNDTTAAPSLKKKFNDLYKQSQDKLSKKIYCVFYSDPTEADKWIRLKHTGENEGIGTVPWDGQQKARYQVRVGEQSSPGLQVLEYLKSSASFDNNLKSKLPKVAITTLTRLVTDKDVQAVLGVAIENGQVISKLSEVEVLKGYSQVIKDLLRKDFNVKSVYTKEQREEYAKNFPASSRPNLALATNQPWAAIPSAKGQPAAATSTSPKAKKAITDRNKVIPKNCIIKISNPKVNDIYDEL